MTTIVSLVHAAYIVTEGGLKVLISALVEVCRPSAGRAIVFSHRMVQDSVSLMVANLPVLVTAAMRAYGVRVIDEDSVPTARLTTMRFDPFAKVRTSWLTTAHAAVLTCHTNTGNRRWHHANTDADRVLQVDIYSVEACATRGWG